MQLRSFARVPRMLPIRPFFDAMPDSVPVEAVLVEEDKILIILGNDAVMEEKT